MTDAPDPIAPHADEIIEHMNADHPSALEAYCHAFGGEPTATDPVMTAVDANGFEVSASVGDILRTFRFEFDAPVKTVDDVRETMVAMVKRARAATT